MPNLVGIGNSQVPTNAMLGGLAYQDSVGEIDLEKIKARISGTAVDIFVYDTRKDSDGGAWRHRTQNTSWYNEVPSMTRGARKEFPAVAVIVVTGGAAYEPAITIYDGDDPNLPMWMVFNNRYTGGGSDQTTTVSYYAAGPYPIRKIAMLNGIMVDCQYRSPSHIANIVKGVTRYNFIDDSSIMMTDEGDFKRDGNLGDLRNTERAYTRISGSEIVHTQCNDIAITVLPNAPIDDTTGLPRPTIAVATDGGVSVIKDNGYAVVSDSSIYGRPIVKQINFKGERLVGLVHQTGNTSDGVLFIEPLSRIPFPEGTDTRYPFFVSSDSALTLDAVDTNGNHPIEVASESVLVGGNEGLGIIKENKDSPTNGMLAHIAKDFNTGYQHGDIRTTHLSSTDTTNINGTSLIANGDFSSNSTAAFTTVSGGTAAVVGGLLKLTDTEGAFCYASAPFTTVIGNQYYVTVDIVNNSNTAPSNYIRCGNSHNGIEFHNTNYGTSYGTKTFYFVATATTTYLTLISGHGAGNPFGHWDNVFVYKLDNDRSPNKKGLQPYGTISKAKVATGADLAYYGGFSNSNYFSQPYNSALDFGTGDLCIMFWAKFTQNNAYDDLIHRRAHNGSAYTGNGWYLQMGSNNNIVLKDNLGGSRAVMDGDSTFGVWQHFCFMRRNNIGYSYKNGIRGSATTPAWNENLDNSSAILTIGRGTISGSGDADKTFLALVRISAGAPSEEQIKKIFNDEKHLFNENAKCTLYGTTNDIDAIAYDDSTDIVHVGTLSGRSDFNGLVRINNTTRGISTQLSASNGLVAEQ